MHFVPNIRSESNAYIMGKHKHCQYISIRHVSIIIILILISTTSFQNPLSCAATLRSDNNSIFITCIVVCIPHVISIDFNANGLYSKYKYIKYQLHDQWTDGSTNEHWIYMSEKLFHGAQWSIAIGSFIVKKKW